MTWQRMFLSTVMILVVALATMGEGVRGIRNAGATEITLCDGMGGMTTIRVDRSGEKLPIPADCADCRTWLLATLPQPVILPAAPDSHDRPLTRPAGKAGRSAEVPHPLARAPPALI
jgi:hypothetical protein